MNVFQQEYNEKLCSLEKIYNQINDGDYIVTGFAGCEPVGFFNNLHTISNRIDKIRIAHSLDMMHYKFKDPLYGDKFQTESFFLMGSGREAMRRGVMRYIPGNLHDSGRRQVEVNEVNVFVVAVSPMDKMGYFRTSLCSIAEDVYAKSAKKIIVEVVPNMPIVYGDNEIHISDVDAIFECDRIIPTIESLPLSEEEIKIGQYVASLVDDGSTIQLGIGGIPDAVARALMGKKHLGIHTEMITNSVVDLVEKGVITGKNKSLHRGKIIGTFALGNQSLYEFIKENPAVAIMPGHYVNDPKVIAQNDQMVSINTAIAVDFTGQIASESIGFSQYSGTGGQSDTAIGAIHSQGGKSIIALRSTAKSGDISTINAFLPLGSIVTLSRNNIDYIVTEYGIANMKSQPTCQRTKSLISIAHPKFREELKKQALSYGYLK